LEIKAIEKCNPKPDEHVSPIFLVPKSNGEKRFILNLKRLNRFIRNSHFKMEDLRTARRLMSPGCYFVSIDIKDAFFHVNIIPHCRRFLRFKWNGTTYEFGCLPFGLCTAPRVFTKLMKPIMNLLRSENISCVIYIDDLLLIANSYQECLVNIDFSMNLLTKLGFQINTCKSVLTPTQKIKFLGFELDSTSCCVRLSDEKAHNLRNLCTSIKNKNVVSIRELSKVIGTMISVTPAVTYGLLYTRQLEFHKINSLSDHHGNFEAKITLSKECLFDIDWWLRNSQNSSTPVRVDVFSHTMFTDASKTGWGAVCGSQRAGGAWKSSQSSNSINYLELLAVYYGLRSFFNNSHNLQLLLRIDNTTAICYINRMGGVKHRSLNILARKIWQWCEARQLWINATYITSRDNFNADKESRRLYSAEWSLDSFSYNLIITNLGYTPKIDLFASTSNYKCPMFVSWRPDPYAWAVDAFTIPWNHLEFYAFPPFSLILRVLQKIISDHATGILIVPLWPTQPWFPLFNKLCVNKIILPPDKFCLSLHSNPHPLSRSLFLVAGLLSGKLSS